MILLLEHIPFNDIPWLDVQSEIGGKPGAGHTVSFQGLHAGGCIGAKAQEIAAQAGAQAGSQAG